MSYLSTIQRFQFSSELPENELKERWNSFKTANSSLSVYSFHLTTKIDQTPCQYVLNMEDYKANHESDNLLAKFVAEVIKPGTLATIMFHGEDFAQWGYLIASKQVYFIESRLVVDDVPLEDFQIRL